MDSLITLKTTIDSFSDEQDWTKFHTKIELFEDSTRVTLFAGKDFSSLSMEDKLWACYLHACIKQVQGEQLTNSSLRNRFGLKESSSGSMSRLIKESVSIGTIKPLDPTTAPRYMKYIPWWA